MNFKVQYFCLNCGRELSERDLYYKGNLCYHTDDKGADCGVVEAMLDDEGKEDNKKPY